MKYLVILTLLPFYVSATMVLNCEDGSLLPNVSFYGRNNELCDEPPCLVKPGSDLVLDVLFKSPKYLEDITPKIKATALGVSLDYPLFQNDACKGIINTYCPIVADEIVEYSYVMHLLDVFPEVTVGLKFSIVDNEEESNVVCFAMDITVTKV